MRGNNDKEIRHSFNINLDRSCREFLGNSLFSADLGITTDQLQRRIGELGEPQPWQELLLESVEGEAPQLLDEVEGIIERFGNHEPCN